MTTRPLLTRSWVLATAVVCILTGCKPEAPTANPTPAQPELTAEARPLIVAHRGASADAPENTLAAFRLGFEQGADAIEGDFWLSADEVVVSHHDRSLERTTGDLRAITEVSAAELATLDVGNWGPWAGGAFVGEPIPTLEAILDSLPPEGRILIEIKDGPDLVWRMLESLDARVEAGTLDRHAVAIISFDPSVLDQLMAQAPSWTNYLLVAFHQDDAGEWHPSLDELLETARALGTDGLDLEAEPAVIDAEFVAALHAAGFECHVWTVDDPAWAKSLADYGVDSITTNVPAVLRPALESR